ncbi:alpha/beta hydrolase-fold protein [Pseudoduganella sp. SL102]|uniref:extracellular catalytic domain type 1 short-chain-length polyhydroxyalkanoate depolymerase n=1 Tax=Pseudoduganella sp. SL102 TaxID=2995154 RepID=UPI00248C6B6C|nr:PHB depolymerase family esterase [Pseudoduganella sp. SL102]WBS03032.1 alpha/beta hydrolase-fold protein [Pseudoduganella sp. SL102]
MKILLSLVVLACTAVPVLAQVKSLVHKEEKRRYLVYTPPAYAAAPNQAFPVVFNFHGGGMTMAEQMLYTQMNRAADRHGFIVVYPAGIKGDWNVGFGMSYLEGTDDIGFTAALLDKLKADYRVDPRRVYATGLSRGGFFALRIAAELPHLFAAVAPVGAPMPEPVVQHHANPGRVGMLLVHGTADEVVAYAGKPAGYLSAEDTYGYWLKRNGLRAEDAADGASRRVIDTDAGDGTSVTWIEAGNGQQSVALATIREGGHTWPGADPFNVGLPIGKTSRDLDANEAIWRFFEKHRR